MDLSEDQILECNKLIAESPFGGIKIRKNGDFRYLHNKEIWALQGLKYHTSWDWLMPVIEKISQFKFEDGDNAYLRTFGMISDDGELMVRFNRSELFMASTLIEATYMAVVDFINWTNEQTTNLQGNN